MQSPLFFLFPFSGIYVMIPAVADTILKPKRSAIL